MTLALARGGFFTGTEASKVGVDPMLLARTRKAGAIRQLRRNAYVLASAWEAADAEERFRLTARAILLGRPASAGSHRTALLLHRLPVWPLPTRVEVVAPVTRSWVTPRLHVRPAAKGFATTDVDGTQVVPIAVALAQTAVSDSMDRALVPMDAALNRGCVTKAAILEQAGEVDSALVRRVVGASDRACESPGETRTRVLLRDLGFDFRSQVVITDREGRFVGRVDFLVEGRVVVEFDGAVKYGGVAGRDALVAEKVREDRLRALGLAVVRLTWSDLDDPAEIGRKIRKALSA